MRAGQGRTTVQAVRAALAGGAGVIQLRLKDTDGGAFLQQVSPALAPSEQAEMKEGAHLLCTVT